MATSDLVSATPYSTYTSSVSQSDITAIETKSILYDSMVVGTLPKNIKSDSFSSAMNNISPSKTVASSAIIDVTSDSDKMSYTLYDFVTQTPNLPLIPSTLNIPDASVSSLSPSYPSSSFTSNVNVTPSLSSKPEITVPLSSSNIDVASSSIVYQPISSVLPTDSKAAAISNIVPTTTTLKPSVDIQNKPLQPPITASPKFQALKAISDSQFHSFKTYTSQIEPSSSLYKSQTTNVPSLTVNNVLSSVVTSNIESSSQYSDTGTSVTAILPAPMNVLPTLILTQSIQDTSSYVSAQDSVVSVSPTDHLVVSDVTSVVETNNALIDVGQSLSSVPNSEITATYTGYGNIQPTKVVFSDNLKTSVMDSTNTVNPTNTTGYRTDYTGADRVAPSAQIPPMYSTIVPGNGSAFIPGDISTPSPSTGRLMLIVTFNR